MIVVMALGDIRPEAGCSQDWLPHKAGRAQTGPQSAAD